MYPDTTLNGLVALLQNVNIEDNYHQEPEYIPVPLTEVNIQVRVVNFIAQVEVTQKYVNKEKNPIEAIYFFPVEEEAAVVEFTAKLEGRTVKTVVKEKQKAEEEFKEAVTNRQTAFLLEETKPDIFQVKVGHLSPGAACEVTIIYLAELPVEDGKTRITIPTTITPKYVPASDNSAAAKKIASIEYDFTSPVAMTLKMDALMKTKIKGITSPSHGIDTKIEPEQDNFGFFVSTTTFKGLTADMDRDIVFLVDTDEPNEPKFVLEKDDDGSAVGMLSLVPSFDLKDHTAEIIFLIDCSGSMGGESINLAKEALQLFLHSLPVDCYFNIFRFGSSFKSLFPQSTKYDDNTLQKAKQLALTMDADFGGTEILTPLKHIFSQNSIPGKPKQIFVLTDGAVSNSEACVTCVKQNSSTTRVFTIGIGSGADRHLVKGMARAGKGSAVFATYGELIAPKVLKQLKNSLQPCISNIKVNWGDDTSTHQWPLGKPVMETAKTLLGYGKPVKQDTSKIHMESQAPVIVPPVYDGSRLLIYKMYNKEKLPKCVKITAETSEGPLELEIPIENESLEGKAIHQMFARKMIQDLEEGNYDFANGEETKNLVIELGTKYGLASKFTSFIGVDDQKNKEVGVMNTRQVKNQINQGYGGLQNATNYFSRRYSGGSDETLECAYLGGGGQERSRGMGGQAKRSKKSGGGIMNNLTSRLSSSFGMFSSRSASNESETLEKCVMSDSMEESEDYGAPPGCPAPSATRSAPRSMSRSSAPGSAPPPPPPGSIAPPPLTDRQKLLDLTSLQIANGSFKKDEVFANVSGKSLSQIDEEAKKNKIDKSVWFTALVVALLETMFANDKDSWEMIVDKAKNWIKKEGADQIDVIQKAKAFLQ